MPAKRARRQVSVAVEPRIRQVWRGLLRIAFTGGAMDEVIYPEHDNLIEDHPVSLGDDKHYLDHLKKVNDVFYDQVKIADQKAAYIFTFMLAFMITSAEGRSVFSLARYQGGDWIAALIAALLAAAVMITVVSAILVVLPRSRSAGTSLYWGAWDANREGFIQANRSGDPGYLIREYLGNVDNLAHIAQSKYRFVGLAFRGLVVTVLAYAVLLAIG